MKGVSEKIKDKLRDNHFKVFSRPGELNIVAMRKAVSKPGNFEDELHVFFLSLDGNWMHHVYNIVTDPGTYWMGKKGKLQCSLMLAHGQYLNSHSIFRKSRSAVFLKQVKPVTVYPKYDRKAFFDLFTGKKETGLYNIHLLPAKSNGKYLFLTPDMEGAQVFQRKEDFEEFMNLCKAHEKLYGNAFTYTLLDERAERRKTYTKIGAIATMVISFIGAWIISGEDE